MEQEFVNPERKIKRVKKRNGEVVPYDKTKIRDAFSAANNTVYSLKKKQLPEYLIDWLTDEVEISLVKNGTNTPDVDYINQKGIDVMREKAKKLKTENLEELSNILTEVADSFEYHRDQRKRAREIRVKEISDKERDSTDMALQVVTESKERISGWDRELIKSELIYQRGVDRETAKRIAKNVEKRILDSRLTTVTTELVRALEDNELIEAGLGNKVKKYASFGMPTHDLEQLFFAKSAENSNIAANNPEAVNLAIAEDRLKKYALNNIFSEDVANAHFKGRVHIHDLGYPIRTYCSSHSLEYLKKYGLKGLETLSTKSASPSHVGTLTGHLNTFLASMQANYAGALGLGYMNVFYAPLIKADREESSKNKKKRTLKQEAQYLIFSLSQNAFSRGGQVLFIDANVHSGIPEFLKEVPAIGPKGKYMIKKEKILEDLVNVSLDEFRNGNLILKKVRSIDSDGDEEDKFDYEVRIKEASGERAIYSVKPPEEGKNELYFKKSISLKEKDGKVYITREYDHIDLVDEDKIRDKDGNVINLEDEEVLRYKYFEKEAGEFAEAMFEVWGEGDEDGRVFAFPKCNFHVNEETFKDPKQYGVFKKACQLASKNGSTYFFFDRAATQISQCCRLRETITDETMIKRPETMRFCGFQNITINLPQAAYRAGKGNLEGMIKDIGESMELAAKAHIQKKKFVKKIMERPGRPLWQIGKPANDGRPYVDLEKATYIIGLVGLNEAIQYITGKELHDGIDSDQESYKLGIKVAASMFKKKEELSERYHLKFAIEESPAESATRRIAKMDLNEYPEQTRSVIKGNQERDETYYTNSIHFRADAPIDLMTRIKYQSKFHNLIESGAIIHAFVGEKRPSPESIENLVKKIWEQTNCAQFVISPEFTYCNDCTKQSNGIKEKCGYCDSKNIEGVTRIVGYFSKLKNWNKSKLGELKDRQNGNYNIGGSGERLEEAVAN